MVHQGATAALIRSTAWSIGPWMGGGIGPFAGGVAAWLRNSGDHSDQGAGDYCADVFFGHARAVEGGEGLPNLIALISSCVFWPQ